MIKRGQISIFIIFAIVLIAIFLVFFLFRNNLNFKEIFSPNSNEFSIQLQNCIENVTNEGLKEIALRGGYYEVPSPRMEFFGRNIPYYWHDHKLYLPGKERLEKGVSDYLEVYLEDCVRNISDSDYSLEFDQVSVKSNFFEKKLVLDIIYPVILKKEGSFSKVEKFQFTIKTSFYENYLFLEEVLMEQVKDSDSIPLGFIMDLAYENEFDFDSITLGNDVIYLFIFDYGEKDQIIFSFANKYYWEILEDEN